MPAKKHHHVPVFYQKGFVGADGLLWVYDRKLATYKALNPKVVCRQEDLYAVKPDKAPRDRRIETDILSPVESSAAPIIRRLAPGVRLNADEIRTLAFFIGLQFTRLPSFGRAVARTVEATLEQYARVQFATMERATAALERLEAQTGHHISASPESMVDSILNRKIRFTATERPFLEHMLRHAEVLSQWIEDAEWTILVAPQSSGFIVCDHPFVSVPPEGATLEGMGYGVPGARSYFPLTERLCLSLRHGDFGYAFRSLDSRTVRVINHNIAANSDRFIMGPNARQLEAVINKSGSRDLESGERFSVEVVKANQNESLLKFTIHPRRYFYM